MHKKLIHRRNALSTKEKNSATIRTVISNFGGKYRKLGSWKETSIESRRWALVSIEAIKLAAGRLFFGMWLTLTLTLSMTPYPNKFFLMSRDQ